MTIYQINPQNKRFLHNAKLCVKKTMEPVKKRWFSSVSVLGAKTTIHTSHGMYRAQRIDRALSVFVENERQLSHDIDHLREIISQLLGVLEQNITILPILEIGVGKIGSEKL